LSLKQNRRTAAPAVPKTSSTRGDVKRFYPDPKTGLTSEQVKARVQQGLYNGESNVKTKSEKQIIRENIFTFFNILCLSLAFLLFLVGAPLKNFLFLGIIIINSAIGSFQEIRAKRTIEKLSLISAPKAAVMRNGEKQSVQVFQIVLDDVLILASGNQVCSDAVVSEGECEVNESLITGESDPVIKRVGDQLLSGSFISSGNCTATVEHVGAENYAAKIAGDAKYVKKRNSEIMNSIGFLVRIIGFGILPIGALMFWKQYFVLSAPIDDSVVSTVTSMIGMIPDGLVLLTSVVFAVSVIRLSSHKTLVQDLYCIETLARVDTLCLDKTGTITEGSMLVDEFIPFEEHTQEEMTAALNALVCSLSDDNPTFMALKEYLPKPSNWNATNIVPFSSARKWSGAFYSDKGSYIMGAGEFVLGADFEKIRESVETYSEKGQRVLLLAHSKEDFDDKELPTNLECIGLVLIEDKIRREASRTLRYFADQGVDLKVISGDNAVTVSYIAKKAGLETADKYVDATTLHSHEDIYDAVKKYSVFGRVTPQQKLAFVKALKTDGHTVAMTGDGVNDVLALKEADCSVAMASGSDAARTVSNLVLLDSNFASMPIVVREGRRSINNLQRSASLFLVKTIFFALLAVLLIFIDFHYPFEPIQLTLISTLTIGIPSFILALEPNKARIRGKFLVNVIKMAIPAALTMTSSVMIICHLCATFNMTQAETSTLTVIVTALSGLLMLFKVCTPFNSLRVFLFTCMLSALIVAIIFFQDLFVLTALSIEMLMILVPTALFAVTFMLMLLHFVDHVISSPKSMKKFRRLSRKAARLRG